MLGVNGLHKLHLKSQDTYLAIKTNQFMLPLIFLDVSKFSIRQLYDDDPYVHPN